MIRFPALLLTLALLVLAACQPAGSGPARSAADAPSPTQPAPIAYGEDQDPYCDQPITNERYGAVLILKDGTRHTFASAECMIGFELDGRVAPEAIAERWVVDVVRNKQFLPATEAHYLHTKNQSSPGGLNLSPFNGDEDLSYNMRFLLHGDDLSWNEAVEVVRTAWFTSSDAAPATP